MTRDEHRKACAEAIMSFMEWDDLYGSRRAALGILDALHGIAVVLSKEAAESISAHLRKDGFTAFGSDDVLTNPPEEKP